MREMRESGVEWIGEIPADWEVLEQKWLMRKTKSICEHWRGEPILSLTVNGVIVRDIGNGKGKFPATFDGYQFINKGNLVLCLFDMDVTPRCVGLAQDDGIISPAYSQFEVRERAFAPYYSYYLRAMDDQKLYVPLTSTLRHSFTEETFGAIRAVRPPLDEQRRIADYLDAKCVEIDRAIVSAEASIEELGGYRKNLVGQATTSGLKGDAPTRPTGIGWLGPIPTHWRLRKMKFCFEVRKDIAGYEGPTVLACTKSGVRPKNLANGTGQLAQSYANYQLVSKGDFIMNNLDLVGGWVDASGYDGVTSPDYRVFRARTPELCNDYYRHLFQFCYMGRVFRDASNVTEGMGWGRMQARVFNNFMIPVPPLDEQRRIADYLDAKCAAIADAIAAKQAIIDDLKAYKQSLIYETVTGKREV